MERINMPAIYCPFSSQLNPHVEAVQTHSLMWVKRFRLIQSKAALQRFSSARFAWLAARAHPTAGLEELSLICDWHVWLFLFDDQFDDGDIGRQPERIPAILEHLLSIVNTSLISSPQGPIAEALEDFWQRAVRFTTSDWHKRFARDLADYFAAYNWEVENRVQKSIPDVSDYIENRRKSGSLATSFDLIDISQHLDLPEYVYNNQALRTLRRTASNVVCWVNDLFSLQKELARGEVNNLVVAVQHAHGCTLQEAVNSVCTMVSDEVHLFLQTEQHLPVFSSPIDQHLGKYLLDLRSWMRGNLDWSRETPRYTQVEYTAPGQALSYLEEILPP